ncbi:MAG TPA: OmpA family protein [Terriglobales bacterium]|nr:OmpA family protein [Terriglobales bacterium]
MSRALAVAITLAVLCVTVASAAPVNLTGLWQPKYWTVKVALQQEGDRVWGVGGQNDHWFRGHWDGTRLLLVANDFTEKRKNVCKPRGVFAITGTTVSSLTTTWWQDDTKKPHKGPWTRLSPDPGPAVPYPYATELTACGSLRTYELVFASGADTLQGSGWPILEAVAATLKQQPSMKIHVAGHTDAVGDAAKNQDLSERRAAAVKKALVDTYGADEARIGTKGWGVEQPIADNGTDEGRALNRRVEIVLAR